MIRLLKSLSGKRRLFYMLASVALLIVFQLLFDRYIAPTRVALVNYQSFQVAKLINAKEVGWVKVESFSDEDFSALGRFDFVMVFGRGLKLSEEQLRQLKQISSERIVVVDAAMNPAHAINTIPEQHKASVMDYIDNAGAKNYQNLLRYIRADIQQKIYSSIKPEAVLTIANDVIFHLAPDAIFETLDDYEVYYRTLSAVSDDSKKVVIMTSVPGPFNANRDHVDALITRLEREGYRVYPLASANRRLDFLQSIEPDLVIFMPHGRLHIGDSRQAIDWLKQRNIPVLSPLSVFEDYEDWLQNPQGYSGALLSMNVVLPELDGAVAPYVLNAQFDDVASRGIFKVIPERLEKFVALINGYVDLKSNNNRDKKVAIVYFRGPGKNALVAGNMEVAPSLYNTLRSLQSEGYNLSGLPDSFAVFKALLDQQGTVMTPRAPGQSRQFLSVANPAFIPAEQYQQWCYAMLMGLCKQVNARYGPAPGNFLVDEQQGIAVARLQFGNVAILPQPLPGFGSNTFQLIHGTDTAPPHSYLAAYFWLRHTFKADAVIHYGTHGSLEFTPKKQVALSEADWADALLGGIPHFYLYTMSNVGEAIIAKRRSYATIINHLTPPFSRAGLTGGLRSLEQGLTAYSQAEGAVQEQLRQQLIQTIRSLKVDTDLDLATQTLEAQAGWREAVYQPVSEWLETIAEEKITEGLYTLGKSYSKSEINATLNLMYVDTLRGHIEAVAGLAGNIFSVSTGRANDWIEQRMNGVTAAHVLSMIVGEPLLEDVQAWRAANPVVTDMDIVRGFVALSDRGKQVVRDSELDRSDDNLEAAVVEVLADPEARTFIESLRNEKTYSHVAKVVNPEAAKRAMALAKVIPAIGEALAQLEKPPVKAIVMAMNDQETRKTILQWLSSDDFSERVKLEQARRIERLIGEAGDALALLQLSISSDEFSQLHWQRQKSLLSNVRVFKERFLDDVELQSHLTVLLKQRTGASLDSFRQQIEKTKLTYESTFGETAKRYTELAARLALIEQLFDAIPASRGYLQASSHHEARALINALNGGYIEPAAGGDPVLNPLALPTGRNMFSIDAEKTPSAAAWKVGVGLAKALINTHLERHNAFPKKVAFTLWPSSFIHSQGATVAEILYLLGVEPVRDPFGRIQSLRLITEQELGRPRIDVVVQSAGQLRDLAASRLALIEEAVVLAAGARDEVSNFVREGVQASEQYLLQQGLSPLAAKTLSARRSFGGVNNNYGTGIMGLVERSDQWKGRNDIASRYLKNMGAAYGDKESWGQFNESLFAAALLNTEVIIQPRSSNTWGALSLDHVYEFMGGLSAAVTQVTGSTPEAYFNDYRNSASAKVTELEETIRLEARATLLNSAYISGLISEGGASSAEVFAETFRNTFGWNAMRPEAIDNALWEQLYTVYMEDSLQLGLSDFFEKQNPYALQEMTGVMLEASRKGYWRASEDQLGIVASMHAQLTRQYEAGCGNFTCGNPDLRTYIESLLAEEVKQAYREALDRAELDSEVANGIVLVEKSVNREGQKKTSTSPFSEPGTEAVREEGSDKQAPSMDDASSAAVLRFMQFWPLLLIVLVALLWRRRVGR